MVDAGAAFPPALVLGAFLEVFRLPVAIYTHGRVRIQNLETRLGASTMSGARWLIAT